ncbi:MAG: S-layer homology domain-containing protein, partial [Oscillospiraceae bacterium]|nr:S-layer homology domain-containing protein [Oscillospiraceae bacterium]
VTFLWRFIDTPDSTKKEVPFTDVDSEQYYYQAVLWAYHNGIFVGNEGDGKRTLSVAEGCSRAYVVTYLYNCFLQPDFSQHR